MANVEIGGWVLNPKILHRDLTYSQEGELKMPSSKAQLLMALSCPIHQLPSCT